MSSPGTEGHEDARSGEQGRAASGGPDGTATRVVLVRHGESVCSVRGLVGGLRGCSGLTARGIRQAEALRDRIRSTGELDPTACLYSSVLPRAVQTAEIIAPALGTSEVKTDCGLCELHPGDCDGMTWAQFKDLYGEPDLVHEPHKPLSRGGESWAGFLERVETNLRALADRHEGETAVIACHGGVVEASLLTFLAGGRLGLRLGLGPGNGSITEWEVRDGRWRLVRYNDTAHTLANRWR